MGKAHPQPARKIIAIRPVAGPLPFQAILDFDDTALGRVGGAGHGWPAGRRNHRGAGARRSTGIRWLLSSCRCGPKKQNYREEPDGRSSRVHKCP